MKISYAIPVCNEIEEIKRLLTFLQKHKRPQDEIIIFYDVVNGTTEVRDYLKSIVSGATYNPIEEYPIRWYSYDFDGHFGNMKNELTEMCFGNYIFQIDADEIPSEKLIEAIPYLIEENPSIDVMLVPRVNTVEGLTSQHVEKWGWKLTPECWVNWPDYQWRIYKNSENIKWINKIHERLDGFKTYSALPADPTFALQHPKTIERQEKQNEYYDKL